MYNVKEKVTVSQTRETVDEILSYPIRAIPDRGITKETCEKFGVRVSLSETDGSTITAIYYPYSHKGKITGFKKKDLTVPKGDKGHFTTVGKVDILSDLFGTMAGQTGGKKIFICEGENDCLAAYQVLKENYPSGEPTVLSIGLGTANAASHISNNLKYVQNFSEVVLSFDMDEANEVERKKGIKKGKEAVQDVAKLIPDVKIVELSEKDANDMILAGKAKDLYWALVSKAKVYVPEEVKFGGDISVDELIEPLKEGVYVSCFPKLMKMLHGFRPGELTVFLAPAGAGKTTVSKEIGFALNASGSFIGNIFLEEDIKKTQQSYIALDNNVLLPAFRENPTILSREQVQASYDKLINNGRTVWLEHFGSIANESLMDKLRYMAAAGAQYIILDHLSMVISGQETDNERKLIDKLLMDLAAYVTSTGVHVIAISHIKRNDFKPPQNKDTKEIEYPYWVPVKKEDARGSGAFEQLAFNVVTIEPEIIDEAGTRGRIRLRVQKSREWGETGLADITIMDRSTGRLVDAEEKITF